MERLLSGDSEIAGGVIVERSPRSRHHVRALMHLRQVRTLPSIA
jgi:hypothetical protein